MIWLTWRQFRGAAMLMVAVLVAFGAVLAVTGPGLASRYSDGIADCTKDETCTQFFERFFGAHEIPFLAAGLVVLLVPALIGLFWGAPLITRELEADTHLLVWNQGITRRRWLTVKLVFIGLTAMAVAALCGLVVTWWSGPLDRSAPAGLAQMAPLVFGARGIVPMGYAIFAFVLGLTVGMLVRRTLLAMGLTLAVFVAIQLAMPLLVRAHLTPPVTSTFEISKVNLDGIGVNPEGGGPVDLMLGPAVPGDAGAWVLSNEVVDASGKTIAAGGRAASLDQVSTTSGPCAPGAASPDACLIEINQQGYRQQVTYQPLDRFWRFQWMETGIYGGLAVGLTWFSFWWIRRRLS